MEDRKTIKNLMHPLRLKLSLALPMLMLGTLACLHGADASGLKADHFPRTADYYLKAGIGIPSSDEAALAKYDVIVLPAEAQVFNPNLFGDLRRANPNIVILA